MRKLTRDSATEFLDRFYSFHDSLVRTIEINFKAGSTSAKVVIAVRDINEQDKDGWVTVVFQFDDVWDFNFYYNRSRFDIVVMSFGINVLWLVDGVGIDFGGLTSQPETLSEFRESQTYVCAKSVTWSVESYY